LATILIITIMSTAPVAAKTKRPGLLYLHGHVLEKVGSRTYSEYNLKRITKMFTDKGFVVSALLRDRT